MFEPVNLEFSYLRKNQAALTGLITEILRIETGADCCLISSGSVRADCKFEGNHIYNIGDVFTLYPFDKLLCLVELVGEDLYRGLEQGISKYPSLEGRYPQLSGISFDFDKDRPPCQRIDLASVMVGGKPIDLSKKYRVALTGYLANGKDGYEAFTNCKHLIHEDARKEIRTLLLHFFSILSVANNQVFFIRLAIEKSSKNIRNLKYKEAPGMKRENPSKKKKRISLLSIKVKPTSTITETVR